MTKRHLWHIDNLLFHALLHLKHYKRAYILISSILLMSVLVVLDSRHHIVPKTIRTTIVDVLSPVSEIMTYPLSLIARGINVVEYYTEIYEENQQLRKENNALIQYFHRTEYIQHENQQLKSLLNAVAPIHFRYISARIMFSASTPFLRHAVIQLEGNSPVQPKQTVVSAQGLVGRILETGNRTARILLITDINSRIPAITATSRERGIVAGTNSDTLSMHYLPKNSNLTKNELVLTSGDGSVFPPGIPIGHITQMQDGTATITPLTQWNSLEYVTILQY